MTSDSHGLTRLLDSVPYGRRVESYLTQRTRGYVVASLLLAALVLTNVAIFAFGVVSALTSSYEYLYGEGFVLYFATNPGMMFHPVEASPHIPTVYPPVYPLVVGLVHDAFGGAVDVFFLGRLLTVLATLAITVLVARIVASRGGRTRVVPVLAGALFLTAPVITRWGIAARVDVPGLLFSVAALYWFLTREGRSQLVGSALLCLVALYTKQSFVAVPGAITLALALDGEWKRAASFALGLGAAGLAVLGALTLATNGNAYEHLVVYNRQQGVSVGRIIDGTHDFAKHWPFLIAVAAFVGLERRDSVPTVVLVYVALAAAVSTVTSGKLASGYHYFLDLHVALVLVSGLWLDRVFGNDAPISGIRNGFVVAPTLVVLLLSAQFGLFLTFPPDTHPDGAAETASLVSKADGPVLSEDASILVQTGKREMYEPFMIRQLQRTGVYEETPVVDAVRAQKYRYVVLLFDLSDRDEWGTDHWTERQLRTIRRHYELVEHNGDYWVYAPT